MSENDVMLAQLNDSRNLMGRFTSEQIVFIRFHRSVTMKKKQFLGPEGGRTSTTKTSISIE